MDSVQNNKDMLIFFQIEEFSVSMKTEKFAPPQRRRSNCLVFSGYLFSLSISPSPISSSFLNPGAESIAININLNLIIWLFSISLGYVDLVI